MPQLSIEQENLVSGILARTTIRVESGRVSSVSIEDVMHPSIIAIMTPDEVRSLCAIPEFVSMGTIADIVQKLQVSEAQALIIPMVKSWKNLQTLLGTLPITCWDTLFVEPLRKHIESFVNNTLEISQITSGLPTTQKTAFLMYLNMQFLSERLDNKDYAYLDWVLRCLPDDAASNLIIALGPKIKEMIKEGEDLYKVYARIKTSKAAWVKDLGETYLKSTIKNPEDLVLILSMLPSADQFPFMKKLEQETLNTLFVNRYSRNFTENERQRFSAFRLFLYHMPEGMKIVPAHALIAAFPGDYFKVCARHDDGLQYLLRNTEPAYSNAVLDAIGDRITFIVDKRDTFLKNCKPLSRIHTFYRLRDYSSYDYTFAFDNLLDSIEKLMSEVNVPSLQLNGHHISPSNTIAQSIIDECKKKPDHESLLAFLNNKLDEIDRGEEPLYQYKPDAHKHNGELAMRIMYCRMRVLKALHPAPVLNTGANLRI